MDKIIERKKGFQRKHIIWIVGGIVFLFLVFQLTMGDFKSVYRTEKERLSIGRVEEGIFNDYITLTGQVEPISTIYLDAVEGGRVMERLIEEGAMVRKGDVILKMENRQLYQTILDSEAALAEKENYLRNTRISFETEWVQSKRSILDSEYRLARKKRIYQQYQSLLNEGLLAREDFIQSEEDYQYEKRLLEINRIKERNDSTIRATSMMTLDHDLKKMREMLLLVRERIDNLNVRAPVDGQLGMLEAEIGQSITQGQRIGQINVLTDYKVTAMIDEHYVDRVKRELKASVDRQGSIHQLVVRKVYPEVRNGQFKTELVFQSDKPDNIRTGQTYHIRLELGESQKGILLPRGAFFQSTGGQWVFVLNSDGTEATKRPIRIGKQNPLYFEVLEGLMPGEQVITSSYELFGNHDRIVLR
ncbi:MAG: efflux RND transporter periplasmic adaptor subunit [Breznakibacter sp.]